MPRRRARCIRRSTAATTGTRACTCTGCWSHVRRLHPELPQRAAIDALLLTRTSRPPTIAAECAYLARPDAQSFERPYGWAWLLKLAHELARCRRCAARTLSANWRRSRRRSSRAISRICPRRVIRYATACIRTGVRLAFALDYARMRGGGDLERCASPGAANGSPPIATRRSHRSRRAPTFCRRCSMEADLMRRVLPPARIRAMARRVPAGARRAAGPRAVRAGRGQRSQRSADRPSRRSQSVAAWCFREHRGGTARAMIAPKQRCVAPRTRISRPA